jgi:hypothetical protein
MEDLWQKIEENFESWKSTWDLECLSIRDIYEAGFRHGVETAEEVAEGD